jgi:hypothetical protein
MAHATLRFDLADQDDEREHRYALAGREALLALEAIDQRLRSLMKYGAPCGETRILCDELRAMVPHDLVNLLH